MQSPGYERVYLNGSRASEECGGKVRDAREWSRRVRPLGWRSPSRRAGRSQRESAPCPSLFSAPLPSPALAPRLSPRPARGPCDRTGRLERRDCRTRTRPRETGCRRVAHGPVGFSRWRREWVVPPRVRECGLPFRCELTPGLACGLFIVRSPPKILWHQSAPINLQSGLPISFARLDMSIVQDAERRC